MKLIITIIISVLVYFGMAYYSMSSLMVWIVLIVLWAIIDYFTYNNPFTWKDYTILVVILSVVEISALYNYFGLL